MPAVKETQLRYLEYLHREDGYRHHRYDEEILQYRLLREGKPGRRGGERLYVGFRAGGKNQRGHPAQPKYLFVASITLACRAAILGGLEEQRSYDISDLYIQRVDKCATLEEITALHKDMFQFYVNEVSSAKKRHVYSKPVVDAMNFIHYHLHEKLPTQRVAEEVGLSPNYLSQLFKRELGLTVADYVLELRMEAAKNMLRFSSFPYDEIASILAFS